MNMNMTREEYVGWFNNTLTPDQEHLKIMTTDLEDFEKSPFNKDVFHGPFIINGNYLRLQELREAVLKFLGTQKTLVTKGKLKFGYETNQSQVSTQQLEGLPYAVTSLENKEGTINNSQLILSAVFLNPTLVGYTCRVLDQKWYFTIPQLLSDFLRLNLSSSVSPLPGSEEVSRIIKFVENYGPNIIPYDFKEPLRKRIDFFYSVKAHYLFFKENYKELEQDHNYTQDESDNLVALISKKITKKLPYLKILPENEVEEVKNGIFKSINLSKIELFLDHGRERNNVIPFKDITDNLISLLYLYLWKEGVKNYHFTICQNCQKIFWQDPPQRKYCSDACANIARQKVYREKVKTTEKLAS